MLVLNSNIIWYTMMMMMMIIWNQKNFGKLFEYLISLMMIMMLQRRNVFSSLSMTINEWMMRICIQNEKICFILNFFFWGKFCEINQRNQKYVFWVNLVSKKKKSKQKRCLTHEKDICNFFSSHWNQINQINEQKQRNKKKIIQLFFPRKKRKREFNVILSFLS